MRNFMFMFMILTAFVITACDDDDCNDDCCCDDDTDTDTDIPGEYDWDCSEDGICDAMPKDFCQDEDTLIAFYEDYICVDGECHYTQRIFYCEEGCGLGTYSSGTVSIMCLEWDEGDN